MQIKDFVKIKFDAGRSINLERDSENCELLESYHLTDNGIRIIERFVSSLEGERVNAWSLTGPYGMGKSAFLNFLISLTSGQGDARFKISIQALSKKNSVLAERYNNIRGKLRTDFPFFQVSVTSSYEPLNLTLVKGLYKAVSQRPERELDDYQNLVQMLESLIEQDSPSTNKVFDAFRICKQKIYKCPILIVVDEFGKNLEFIAHHPKQGDIFALQLLAESEQIYLWVCLHQAFSEYASALSSVQREEWQKVQGRFEDISFREPASQMLRLITEVMRHDDEFMCAIDANQWQNNLSKWTKYHASLLKELGLSDLCILTSEDVYNLYPLHPLSAYLLCEISRRFAQNGRTMFSFLCSGDSKAVPAFLNTQIETIESQVGLPCIGLDYLYDYFVDTAFSNIMKPEFQRLLEIQSVIDSYRKASSLEMRVIKTIAILNLLGNVPGCKASKELIRTALSVGYSFKQEYFDETLDLLWEQRVLIHRQYADEFRLWEGSDFDFSEALREERAKAAIRPLDEVLSDTFPLSAMIASRHSYENGTTRTFERLWTTEIPSSGDGKLNRSDLLHDDTDGLILYVLGYDASPAVLPSVCHDVRPLVIAYSATSPQIKDLALAAAAATNIHKTHPGIAHDGVARREARYRAEAAQDALKNYIRTAFRPDSELVTWFALGKERKLHSERDLSALLSDLCDRAYSKCPKINNEMINYNKISSSASRARRVLAEAMVNHEIEENLGLIGAGPEVALYRTLFKATELHTSSPNGHWRFVPPREDSDLFPFWETLNNHFSDNENNEIRVSELIDLFRKPPFGMKRGPIPILICHFLLVCSEEIALYQEGVYKPYFAEAELELMMKRPELFTMRRFPNTGIKREFFQVYMSILNTELIQYKDNIRNQSLLKVVAPLVTFVEGLPEYTRFTRTISLRAQKVRTAILNANEPMKLLFDELPQAVDIAPASEASFPDGKWRSALQNNLKDALKELADAYERLNFEIQNIIMNAFNFQGELSDLHKSTTARVETVVNRCSDTDLRSILTTFVSKKQDDQEWMRSIAARIAKKPVNSWHDSDLEPFKVTMFNIADRINSLVKLVATSSMGKLTELTEYSRAVSVVKPDGNINRHLLYPDDMIVDKMSEKLDSLNLSQDELKAFFVLIADRLDINRSEI